MPAKDSFAKVDAKTFGAEPYQTAHSKPLFFEQAIRQKSSPVRSKISSEDDVYINTKGSAKMAYLVDKHLTEACITV